MPPILRTNWDISSYGKCRVPTVLYSIVMPHGLEESCDTYFQAISHQHRNLVQSNPLEIALVDSQVFSKD